MADSYMLIGRVVNDLGVLASSQRPGSAADTLFYSKHTVDFTLDGGGVQMVRLRWLSEEVMGPGSGGGATESLVTARTEGAPGAAGTQTPGPRYSGDVAASVMSVAPSAATAEGSRVIPMRGPLEDLRLAVARADLRTPESGTSTPVPTLVPASNAAAAAGIAARTHARRPSSGASMMELAHQVNESGTSILLLQEHCSPLVDLRLHLSVAFHIPTSLPARHFSTNPTTSPPTSTS